MKGVFLDTETNGLNFHKHRVIEIALKIIDLENGDVIDEYSSVVLLSEEQWALSDPVSLKVNGFKWDEVKRGKPIETVGNEIVALFKQHGIRRGEAVFICQNPSFDRYYFSQIIDPDAQEKMAWPYHWLDLASMFWVSCLHGKLEPWKIGFSKDKIAAAYRLGPEAMPHRAMNGVDHLISCYQAVAGAPGGPPQG